MVDHIHTRQHQEDRSAYFDIYPLCERCIKKGITIESFILHHKDRNQENRSFDNFEALCTWVKANRADADAIEEMIYGLADDAALSVSAIKEYIVQLRGK